MANLVGGYAVAHADVLRESAQREGLNDLVGDLERDPMEPAGANALYYALRSHLKCEIGALRHVLTWDATSGIQSVENRAHVDVDSQVITLSEIQIERIDPRLRMPGLEALAHSDARIINIDSPLGMAAYHLLSRLGWTWPHHCGHIWELVVPHLPSRIIDFTGLARG